MVNRILSSFASSPSCPSSKMDTEQFRKYGHQLIDFIADYHENINKINVRNPDCRFGDVIKALPKEAPQEGEPFSSIQQDIKDIILPTLTHWQSPNFFAFFPANASYPSILGELLSAGLGVQGMLWMTSPACTELEIMVLDWLARALQLPPHFLSDNKGGGVIHGTASETVVVVLVASRHKIAKVHNLLNDPQLNSKLVIYSSDQAHSSVKKACMITGIPLSNYRVLKSDETNLTLSADALSHAIQEDKAKGLIPCCVVATVGTTSTTANDNLKAIGPICAEHNVFLHVDAAYSGSACICPEFRPLLDGIEYADSFNFNPHKWLLVNFDCSCHWIRDRQILIDALSITPEYLRNKASESGEVVDYRDWGIPLGRRFRSLKLWFVLRTYGIRGLQSHIRHHVKLAEEFEQWVRSDDRFEVIFPRSLSLVCFRLKGDDTLSKSLLDKLNSDGKFFLTHTVVNGKFCIRLAVGSPHTERTHLEECWNRIVSLAEHILQTERNHAQK